MNVSAVIVTRGNVDLLPILDSLPREWERVIWNNAEPDGHAFCQIQTPGRILAGFVTDLPNLAVYGRYAAIEYASHDLIYVQDDDCIVSDPQAIVDAYTLFDWNEVLPVEARENPEWGPMGVWRAACNMPEPWASNAFYRDHALVGFGAAFHRDAPKRAFRRVFDMGDPRVSLDDVATEWFHRTCDVVFTALTPIVRVNIPHESFDYAWGDDRMWKQPTHQGERDRMLALALEVRDGRTAQMGR